MLYYKNNRFHIGGLSYALPEDICLITDFERSLNDGFAYKSMDQKTLVTVSSDNTEEEPQQYFESKDFKENNFEVAEVSPFGYANIEGVSAIYSSEFSGYYEIRLNLPRPTETEKALIILVEVENKDIAIKDAIMNPVVTELLLSLRKDLSAPVFFL